MSKCMYSYRCSYHNDDSLCNEVSETCRIRNKYHRQAEEIKKKNGERPIKPRDIGLEIRSELTNG